MTPPTPGRRTTADPPPAVRARQSPGPDSGRTYAGESPEEREQRRRRQLLAACQELFGTYGYSATKVERICALAQVSTRHFYQLYPSKEAAFVDLYDILIRQSYQQVALSLEETEDLPFDGRIAAAFSAYLRPLFTDMRAARVAFVEIVGLSPAIEKRRLEYRETLIAVIESETRGAVARGEIVDRDFRFATLSLIGAATVTVHDWVTRGDGRAAEQIQRQLSDLAISLLG